MPATTPRRRTASKGTRAANGDATNGNAAAAASRASASSKGGSDDDTLVTKFVVVVGVVFVLCAASLEIRAAPPGLPEHLVHHPVHYELNLLSERNMGRLMDMFKGSMRSFPTNIADVKSYASRAPNLREHVGEARPVDEDGSCAHPFLVPDSTGKLCVLPGRIDVGRHFALTGGSEGLKESYDKIISRLQSFGRYHFDWSALDPVVTDLFQDEKFLDAARATCPRSKQVLDPFQFNVIIQLPGQSVALHIDAPYFWGASRFEFPQWLLASMVFSGLFSDKFVDQIQLVAYAHQWNDTVGGGANGVGYAERAGNFIYWDENTAAFKSVAPVPAAGSSVDGSKTVHAAVIYRPNAELPILNKDKNNVLEYTGDGELWTVANEDGPIRNYTTDDLRISIVYRAKCFADEAERDRFNAEKDDPSKHIALSTILGTLGDDLVARGVISQATRDAAVSDAATPDQRLDFAMALMDTYVKYPKPVTTAFVPVNYCALPRLPAFGWTRYVLAPFC